MIFALTVENNIIKYGIKLYLPFLFFILFHFFLSFFFLCFPPSCSLTNYITCHFIFFFLLFYQHHGANRTQNQMLSSPWQSFKVVDFFIFVFLSIPFFFLFSRPLSLFLSHSVCVSLSLSLSLSLCVCLSHSVCLSLSLSLSYTVCVSLFIFSLFYLSSCAVSLFSLLDSIIIIFSTFPLLSYI